MGGSKQSSIFLRRDGKRETFINRNVSNLFAEPTFPRTRKQHVPKQTTFRISHNFTETSDLRSSKKNPTTRGSCTGGMRQTGSDLDRISFGESRGSTLLAIGKNAERQPWRWGASTPLKRSDVSAAIRFDTCTKHGHRRVIATDRVGQSIGRRQRDSGHRRNCANSPRKLRVKRRGSDLSQCGSNEPSNRDLEETALFWAKGWT